LFCVTAALAAALWTRHELPVHWLSGLGARQAQAQSAEPPRTGARENRTAPFPARQVSNYTPASGDQVTAAPPGSGRSFQRPSSPPSGAQLRIPGPAMQSPAAPPGQQGNPPAENGPIVMENAKVIARIGGQHVLLGDIIADVEKDFAQQSKKYHPRDHDALKQMLIYQHIKQIIPIKVLCAAAKKDIPEEKLPDVQKQIETLFNQRMLPILMKEAKVASPEEFDAKLKAEGSSLKRLMDAIGEQQVVQTYIADHTKIDENVSPDELYAHYRAHYDEYKFDAKVRWEQLLIRFKGRSREEAIRILADMGNQVRNGAPWAAVAKARSEGLTATDGGQMEWTTKGSLKLKQLDEALFVLPVGAMSIILEDDRSVQIVRVIERKDAGVVPFEEAQKDIKKLIIDERTKAKKGEFIKSKIEELKPTIWTMFDDKMGAAKQDSNTAGRTPAGQTRSL
jgi:hypothetical protein